MALEDLLKGIQPIPPDVKEAYKDTNFLCSCGGMVIPQTMEEGVCFSCKTRLVLADLRLRNGGC